MGLRRGTTPTIPLTVDYDLTGYTVYVTFRSGGHEQTFTNNGLEQSFASNTLTIKLPAVTAADNGKVLAVVNGAWAVTSI